MKTKIVATLLTLACVVGVGFQAAAAEGPTRKSFSRASAIVGSMTAPGLAAQSSLRGLQGLRQLRPVVAPSGLNFGQLGNELQAAIPGSKIDESASDVIFSM